MKNKSQPNKSLVSGYYEHPEDLVDAVKEIRKKELPIEDIFTPFPIHGLDELAGLKKSRIPTAGFIAGIIGAVSAFWFMTWIFTVDYPLVFGGKPYLAAPSFIPVTFELTVLFTAVGVASALFIRSRLIPRKSFKPVYERASDDRFVILIDTRENEESARKNIQSLLSGIPIVEIV